MSLIGGIIYPGSSHSAAMSDKNSVAAETSAQRNVRMAWWGDTKFGMFINLGYIPCRLGFIMKARRNLPDHHQLASRWKICIDRVEGKSRKINPAVRAKPIHCHQAWRIGSVAFGAIASAGCHCFGGMPTPC